MRDLISYQHAVTVKMLTLMKVHFVGRRPGIERGSTPRNFVLTKNAVSTLFCIKNWYKREDRNNRINVCIRWVQHVFRVRILEFTDNFREDGAMYIFNKIISMLFTVK